MDNELNYFKKRVIEILKQKENAVSPEIKKALDNMDVVYGMADFNKMGDLNKSYGVGTIRIWKGKKYKKVSASPTKWVRVFDKVDRGAKGSMTRLINKADACKSIEELLQFCMSNHALFKDANGVDLPIMDELRKAVDEKRTRLENGDTSSIRPAKKTVVKPVTPKVAVVTPAISSVIAAGDKVSLNGRIGIVQNLPGKEMAFVKFDDGGFGRIKISDLQKIVTEVTVETPEEAHENRSDAMMGNDNAKKDEVVAEEVTKEVGKLESDKIEFKQLVDRINELDKEIKANGGDSYRHTTKEQDEKRHAARKALTEAHQKLEDFRVRVNAENPDKNKIPSVYNDAVNEWIKRKLKGQTISWKWLDKKFGSKVYDMLEFGDMCHFDLDAIEDINNPVVKMNYKDGAYTYDIAIDVGKMNDEQYHPRFMDMDGDLFTEVWKRFNRFRDQLNSTTGNTPAEKFYNMVMGVNNAYNENSETPNLPRFRFTKDGIKDKNGTLIKVDASVRNVGTDEEYIRMYADDYGHSIPSIFYPENDTDIMTDYFEKDNCDVHPDHPYYNHLKIMALKKELFRSRATKWNTLTKEQQKAIENQIKDLEKQLVEPTEDELKNYRVKRDKQEENKEIWKEAQRKVYEKENEEREQKKVEDAKNKFVDLLGQLADALEKEPPVDLNGLSKEEKIETLNDRIVKLGMEINNIKDPETVESKKKFRESLQAALEEVKNEPDSIEEPKESETEKHENRSNAMLGNQNAYKGMSAADLENEHKRLGKEITKLIKENVDIYNKNSGFASGADDDPNSDYQKWLKNGSKIRSMQDEVGKITDERIGRGVSDDERNRILVQHSAAYNGKMEDEKETKTAVEVAKENLKNLEDQKGKGNGFELDKKLADARNNLARAEMDEKDSKDGVNTPIPTMDANVAQRINDISMSGHSGDVYQSDMNAEMKEFREMFNTDGMNEQQKEYFQERLNSYASLVGSSYGDMANKRLSAGPSWVVAGPAKFNNKRYQQKMDAEMRAYDTFKEKKDKFIKNTEKKLKELKYQGGSESVEDVKKKVFDDFANGKYGYGDKIENTDPYAIEKISGKIKYMEDAHTVTLLYNKKCKKAGLLNVTWNDKPEDTEKRKEVMKEVINEAKEKGINNASIKQGLNHPFIQNQTADIKRNKERLAELQKRQAVIDAQKAAAETSNESGSTSGNTGKVDFDGGYIYENPEMDRIQIIYDGKPSSDVISSLKHHGFHWSPSQGAWQRQLNRNGRMAVNSVFAETGVNTKIDIDGAGEVKKSLPRFFVRGGRFLIRK